MVTIFLVVSSPCFSRRELDLFGSRNAMLNNNNKKKKEKEKREEGQKRKKGTLLK